MSAEDKIEAPVKERNPFVWPDLVFREYVCAVLVLLGLIAWSLLLDAPLGEMANPSLTENPAKAPWYFLGLQELLVYYDPWYAGVVLPSIIVLGLILIPYLDTNQEATGIYNFSRRKFAVSNFLFGYALWMVAIFIGVFMRGPNWYFYWPWEQWDLHKVVPEPEMSDFGLFTGLAFITVYCALFYLVPIMTRMRVYLALDRPRYITVMTLAMLMYAVPVKMFLRLFFDIKYILVTPWFNL